MSKPAALVFDFDQTLAPETMHNPMLRSWGLDPAAFWASCTALQQGPQGFDMELSYLFRLVEEGRRHPARRLDEARLRAWGREVELYPGVAAGPWGQGLFDELDERCGAGSYEAFIVSGGMEPMILGCFDANGLAARFTEVFACRMAEEDPGDGLGPRLAFPKEVVGYTAKTQKLFAISKGAFGPAGHPHVNDKLEHASFRIPFKRMLYLGDGHSDIAAFALLKRSGGMTLAVHHPGDDRAAAKARRLHAEGRAEYYFEADYRPGSTLRRSIIQFVLSHQEQGSLFDE